VATTASEGAQAPWDPAQNQWFKDRPVIILPDADQVGRKHAQKVARALDGVAASIKVVDLYPERSDGHDVFDWLQADRVGVRLVKACSAAPTWEPPPAEESKGDGSDASDDELITELAALPKLQYEKRRVEAAKKLGIEVSRLDRLVAEARGDRERKDQEPTLYDHWCVEPCEEPVDGGVLLQAIMDRIRAHVVMSEYHAIAVGLWIIFTWVHEQAVHSPLLMVTSPQANSGKTTLLGLINFLVRRSVQSVSISGPALFRSIEKWAPTFVIDEADTVLANNEDLKEVVNSGWTRGQNVIRCHPVTLEPQPYSTFAPKAIGMKGRKLPDTTLSRAIIIAMKRKRPDEKADDFDYVDNESLAQLRQQLLRFALDNCDAVATATPEIPEGFHNRTRASWKILLAIADQIGGEWKTLARKAAIEIEEVHNTFFDPSLGTQLLADIREAFADASAISSATLVAELVEDPEKPWATYGKSGKPITQKQLAALLKDYGIEPKTVRVPGSTPKGYTRADFQDAFERYVPSISPKTAFSSATSATNNEINELDGKSTRHNDPLWRMEKGEKDVSDQGCGGVADENPNFGPAGCATEARVCAQCHGRPDGTEQLCTVGDHDVWLHRECQRFYR
jgi:hypothetical protein